ELPARFLTAPTKLLRTNDGDRSAKDSPIKTLRNGVEKSGKLEAKAGGGEAASIFLLSRL
ncbi:MAG TPA: hypothetical protein VG125_18690, partial [Pirellulales bacterium]|nr:hypothetical protein [Pirellulales bacterium]